MIETLAISTLIKWGIGTALTVLAGYVLKRIPNEKISKAVEKFFYGIGFVCTGWMSKKLPKLWNKIVEPWIVDLINNVIGAAVRGFIRGLKSDNTEK